MGAREHRDFSPFLGEVRDRRVDLFEVLDEFLAAFHEHERVARVVDVFARAGEVHEFGGLGKFFVVSDLFFDPVFHGLDVVVGAGFNRLDLFAVAFREVVG